VGVGIRNKCESDGCIVGDDLLVHLAGGVKGWTRWSEVGNEPLRLRGCEYQLPSHKLNFPTCTQYIGDGIEG
jgi:hypothetical protein